MRTPVRLLALLALCVATMTAEAKIAHLLPKPQKVERMGGVAFRLGRTVRLIDPSQCWLLKAVLEENGCTVVAATATEPGRRLPTVRVRMLGGLTGVFNHQLEGFPDECYRLTVAADSVLVEATTTTGVLRAAQTLRQLAEGYEGRARLEPVFINDYPAFKVRGFMHDTGRSFISIDELRREIDNLSRFKVNVFHWHLTERQAWRMAIKAFPQLTDKDNMTRDPGCFYTQDDCRQLQEYAAQRGIIIIPEIDMPGHSDAFRRAMGFDMQTDQGVAALKQILNEVAEVFPRAPYIHIGGDEVEITYPGFLTAMAAHVRSLGRRVVVWNRLVAGPPTAEECDMTQLWATSGHAVRGLPNIDCRYNYTNHFDLYADLVGIYKSNIYYEHRGTREVAGAISAAWNDTRLPSERDIVLQNNLYANVLATAERCWTGGGRQYIEQGGTSLPVGGGEHDAFSDFERRFLFHKSHALKDAPIAYVRQSNVLWRISEPFPNGGDKARQFPPETCTAAVLPDSFVFEGHAYGSRLAAGASVWLRHIWHPVVPSFFDNPQHGQTAYAWTYVFSPRRQEAGAQVEFYNYSRSGNDVAPPRGCWDRRGSRLWVNDVEIPAPEWQQPDAQIVQDTGAGGLTNENLTARRVVRLTLEKGWNKVLMRLPYADSGGTRREKWQFTFVLTDPQGRNALDGVVYSPDKKR